jgi:tubulin-specific chaperone D
MEEEHKDEEEVLFAATPARVLGDARRLRILAAFLRSDGGDSSPAAGSSELTSEDSKDPLLAGLETCSAGQAAERFAAVLAPYQEFPQALDRSLRDVAQPLMDVLERAAVAGPAVLEEQGGDDQSARRIDSPPPFSPAETLTAACRCLYALAKMRGESAVERFFPHEVRHLEPALALAERLAVRAEGDDDDKLWNRDGSYRGRAGSSNSGVADGDAQNSDAPLMLGAWEVRFAVLLWLSVLVLIPFDLASVDSDDGARGGLVARTVAICRKFLDDAGRQRDVAAGLAARVLTRPDCEKQSLVDFVRWALDAFRTGTVKPSGDGPNSSSSGGGGGGGGVSFGAAAFRVVGVMTALAAIFGRAKRHDVLEFIPEFLLDLQRSTPSTATQRKLYVKLVQRMGLLFLKPRVAPWRYQRGKRAIMGVALLPAKGGAAADDNAEAENGQSESDNNDDDDDEYDVPEELEDVIEILLSGLRDTDTVVRWSAAKGVGRITNRLPLELADDVVESLFELFSVGQGDSAWHGGCLALAELARRGLLLPNRLAAVVPLISRALVFDERRGEGHSVGAHVRDAACYVCWAFARAYAPEVMRDHVRVLASSLVVVSCLDREVNVRRAAAAAFQESVGRQGSFPFGIPIVTAADFFSVSSVQRTYTDIAVTIAGFDLVYRVPLIEHLVSEKLSHWSHSLRELAGKSLGVLTTVDPALMRDKYLPQLVSKSTDESVSVNERHASLCAIAEVLECAHSSVVVDVVVADGQSPNSAGDATDSERFATLLEWLGEDLSLRITSIIPTLDQLRLYRGRGGEFVRSGACRLIAAIASTRLPLKHEPISPPASGPQRKRERPTIALYQSALEENLRHPNEDIQRLAVIAVRAVTHNFYTLNPPKKAALELVRGYARIAMGVVQSASTTGNDAANPAARRGVCLAMGVLPPQLLAPLKSEIILALSTALTPEATSAERDAETRRNAALGLASFARQCGLRTDSNSTTGEAPTAALSAGEYSQVFNALLRGMGDFCTDNRGDVGSWVRTASMTSAYSLLDLALGCATPGEFVSEELCTRMVSTLIEESCEKLDRVRGVAGEIFWKVVHDTRLPAGLPFLAELRTIFPRDFASQSASGTLKSVWSDAQQTQPKFAQLLVFGPYRRSVLRGLVHAIAGSSQSLLIDSKSVLLSWLKAVERHDNDNDDDDDDDDDDAVLVTRALVELLAANSARDTVPVLKVLMHLLAHDALFCLKPAAAAQFALSAIDATKRVLRGTKEIMRLLAASHVCSLLLAVDDAGSRREATTVLLFLLGHRFPRVRKLAAENFFARVLVDSNCVPEKAVDACSALLSNTKWDGPASAAQKDARMEMYSILGIPKPRLVQRKTAASSGAVSPGISPPQTTVPPAHHTASAAADSEANEL